MFVSGLGIVGIGLYSQAGHSGFELTGSQLRSPLQNLGNDLAGHSFFEVGGAPHNRLGPSHINIACFKRSQQTWESFS